MLKNILSLQIAADELKLLCYGLWYHTGCDLTTEKVKPILWIGFIFVNDS